MIRTHSPGHVKNKFVDRDITMQRKGTRLEAYWLNQVQEEICTMIERHLGPIDPSKTSQLADTITKFREISDKKYIHQEGSGGQVINGNMSIEGNARISGNLIVEGDKTVVEAEVIELADNKITLNSNVKGQPSENGGIEIERGDRKNVSMFWDEANDVWKASYDDGREFELLSDQNPNNVYKYVRNMYPTIKVEHGSVNNIKYRLIGHIKCNDDYDAISLKGVIGDAGYGETCKIDLTIAYHSNIDKAFVTGSCAGNSAGNSILVMKEGEMIKIYLVTNANGIARLSMGTLVNEYLNSPHAVLDDRIQVFKEGKVTTTKPAGTEQYDLSKFANRDGALNTFIGKNDPNNIATPLDTTNLDIIMDDAFDWTSKHSFSAGIDLSQRVNRPVNGRYTESFSTAMNASSQDYPKDLTKNQMGVIYNYTGGTGGADFALSVDRDGQFLWKSASDGQKWKSLDKEISNAIDKIKDGTNVGIDITNGSTDKGHNTINFKLNTEWIQDLVGAMVSGNEENGITVTYNDTLGKLEFTTNDDIPEVDKSNVWTKLNTFNGRIRLKETADVSDNSTNHAFQIGADDSFNIGMDCNEIQARNNARVSTLNLNYHGGDVYIGDKTTIKGKLTCQETITELSDRRVKKNFKVISTPLRKVRTLTGYTYNRTDRNPDIRYTGVVAQDVQQVLPEAVSSDDNGQLSVSYGNMVGLLIESIKELDKEVARLKKEVEKNTKKISFWTKVKNFIFNV